MKLFRKRILKLGNKGLSLVELICGITMLTVIGTSISSIMVVSADGYNRGNSEASVQQEAQLVANQVNDLLIDATNATWDSANTTLEVTQGATVHKVALKTDKKLYYSNGSLEQLMAEGVESFYVDVADFNTYGYAKMKIVFKNNNQTYPADFTMTARNKDTVDAAATASVSMQSQWILEPGQNYTFKPVITPSTATVIGSFALANNTSSNTNYELVDGGKNAKVTIGLDETSPVVRIIYTAKDPISGATLGTRYGNIYVRRVNSMTGTKSCTSVPAGGDQYTEDAIWNFSVAVEGNSLDWTLMSDESGMECDVLSADPVMKYRYVDPKQIEWSIVAGAELAQLTSTSGPDAQLKITQSMFSGDEIIVRAKAMHTYGVTREGHDYGPDVYVDIPLKKTFCPISLGSGWMRQSSQPQANLSGMDTIKAEKGGHNWKVSFRYRKDGATEWETAGISSPYSDGWLPNIYGGDADNSAVANMRPLLTSAMDYRYDYELQIRVILYDAAGNEIWPTRAVGDHVDLNMVADIVPRTEVAMKTTKMGFAEGTTGMNPDAAQTIEFSNGTGVTVMSVAEVIGLDTVGTAVDNANRYILEKYDEATGKWKTPSSLGIQVDNIGSSKDCNITFRGNNFEGKYRIKIELKNMPQYDVNNQKTGTIDYVLWNEDTNEGIFYFNAKDANRFEVAMKTDVMGFGDGTTAMWGGVSSGKTIDFKRGESKTLMSVSSVKSNGTVTTLSDNCFAYVLEKLDATTGNWESADGLVETIKRDNECNITFNADPSKNIEGQYRIKLEIKNAPLTGGSGNADYKLWNDWSDQATFFFTVNEVN